MVLQPELHAGAFGGEGALQALRDERGEEVLQAAAGCRGRLDQALVFLHAAEALAAAPAPLHRRVVGPRFVHRVVDGIVGQRSDVGHVLAALTALREPLPRAVDFEDLVKCEDGDD